MNIKRRHFLQFAGSSLATLGLSQLNIQHQATNYGQVLAKSTKRKLALLIGINEYPSSPLKGCVTDVDLQRHLLIHRFGFNPKDIHTLKDSQATREGILSAFEEYLIKQVRPGDVVVFHFSGHGSRVYDPDPIYIDQGNTNNTIVPIDSPLPNGYPETGGAVKDIMGHTLFLLRSAVNTEYFTTVLDSCHSGGATRFSFKIRARDGYTPGFASISISPLEKEFQEKWLSKLGTNPSDFIKSYRTDIGKGIALAATTPKELAADELINGFHAGAFTYRLTNFLWQNNSTPANVIPKITQDILERFRQEKIFKQTPQYETVRGKAYEKEPVYFINPTNPTANTVVTEVIGNEATLWLGGTDFSKLDKNSVFTVVGGQGKVIYQSRDGLVAKASIQGNVKTGALLRQV
jgi:metacaspase-1